MYSFKIKDKKDQQPRLSQVISKLKSERVAIIFTSTATPKLTNSCQQTTYPP